MNIGVTEISPRAVQRAAEKNFKSGYYCCEALMCTEQDGPTNPKSVKCMELVHELHDWFKKANGKNAICCRVLTKEFNMGQGEHKEQCIFFTGLCAWKVAQIVCRELGIKNLDEIDEPAERRAIADI